MAKREPAPRKRRSAEDAREAILDAAEHQLREVGPGGLRLQDIGKAVGMSHPTVLHHFGSREGLLEAVVARALSSVQEGLMQAVIASEGTDDVVRLLEEVSKKLKADGRARMFLWLALAGYGEGVKGLQVRTLAEGIHEERKKRWAPRKAPPFEDTWFTVMMPALALLSLSVLEDCADPDFDPARFRAFLAKVVHHHLENG
ncbi:MAG: TetR/AcrR family transcriptional regulator [Myxococcaceae bacterium]